MSTSSINIVGTVATEPRMITTQAGITLCTFRLASGERRYDRAQQKWIDGETSWFSVTAFRSLAEHAGKSLRKGERVIVSGRLRVRQWEKEERGGTSVDVEADALGHDLRWGV
ncbi:MAG: single-stranded DNA-binding protein, partial [Actinobacteria bacterium]|nr:single-stranded DNA-binding protein [Actinomycetota bacterium]